MKQPSTSETFHPLTVLLLILIMIGVFCLSICCGSVTIPLGTTLKIFGQALLAMVRGESISSFRFAEEIAGSATILLKVRLPRVLAVLLTGASLSICGASMQGLLKNPLADGSTLGVSTGASLGAAVAIVFGISIPALPFAGTMVMATLFAFGSLIIILTLAYRLDYSLSTGTIILLGVIYSMFVSSLLSLLITFSSDKIKNIVFWTMGSLSGSSYLNCLVLLTALVLCGGILIRLSPELNAFAISEDTARHIGVNVRRTKMTVLITVSVLIGVCVSIGGSIGFVGLVTPHMVRLLIGPNHKKLLVGSLFGGASFLMLCDLVARTLLRPLELPIGVVTSLIGAVVFVVIYRNSKERQGV